MTGYYSHKAVEDLAPPPTGPAPGARQAGEIAEPPPEYEYATVRSDDAAKWDGRDGWEVDPLPTVRLRRALPPDCGCPETVCLGRVDDPTWCNRRPEQRDLSGSSAVTGSGAVPAGAQGLVTDGEAPNGSVHSEGDTA